MVNGENGEYGDGSPGENCSQVFRLALVDQLDHHWETVRLRAET